MTLEELEQIKVETLPSLALRINETQVKLLIGAGDSGIHNASRLVLQEALEEVYNLGLKNVMVSQMPEKLVGQEVVVDVVDENGNTTTYVNIDKNSIKEIITSHIVGKKVVEKYLAKAEVK